VERQDINTSGKKDIPHMIHVDGPECDTPSPAEMQTMTDDEDKALCAAHEEAGTGESSQHLRMVEALLFAASEPLDATALAERLPEGVNVPALLENLRAVYENRGVVLINVGGRWALRTAPDLSFLMERERVEPRRLSKAGIETLSIIAYHQPVTRAEIEEIRGVAVSKGTIDLLMEIGWVRLRGRRRTPGRPITYGTTDDFLDHFGLEGLDVLPGMEELKGAGLLDGRLPPGFCVPSPQSPSVEEEASLQDMEDDEGRAPEFQTDFLEGADEDQPGAGFEANEPDDKADD